MEESTLEGVIEGVGTKAQSLAGRMVYPGRGCWRCPGWVRKPPGAGPVTINVQMRMCLPGGANVWSRWDVQDEYNGPIAYTFKVRYMQPYRSFVVLGIMTCI